MYNNIGILTPRGTGTSGHVQANKFNLTRAPVPRFGEGQAPAPAAADKKPNQAILEHNKKRQIEVKLLELQDELEEQGLSAEEVGAALASKRTELLAEYEQAKEAGDVTNMGNETHAVAQRKQEQMEKMRKAFGLGEVVWGEAFDPEVQERKKQERIEAQRTAEKEAYEKREAARKEREERVQRQEQQRKDREAAAAEAEQRRREREHQRRDGDGYGRGGEGGGGSGRDYRGGGRELHHSANRRGDYRADGGWDRRGHLPSGEGYYGRGDAAPDRYNPEAAREDTDRQRQVSDRGGKERGRGREIEAAADPGREKQKRRRRSPSSSSGTSGSSSSSGSSTSSGSSSSGTSSGSSSSSSGSEDSADSGKRGRRRQQPGSLKRGRDTEPAAAAAAPAAAGGGGSPKRACGQEPPLRQHEGSRDGRDPARPEQRSRDDVGGGRGYDAGRGHVNGRDSDRDSGRDRGYPGREREPPRREQEAGRNRERGSAGREREAPRREHSAREEEAGRDRQRSSSGRHREASPRSGDRRERQQPQRRPDGGDARGGGARDERRRRSRSRSRSRSVSSSDSGSSSSRSRSRGRA